MRGENPMTREPTWQDLEPLRQFTSEEMVARSAELYSEFRRRRTVRQFSDRSVPPDLIRNCLLAAGTAPSGANLQPWHFVVVQDPTVKREIRLAAEEEEREFYANRAPQEWRDALAPLGTDADKPFLEIAPYLIVVFRRAVDSDDQGRVIKQYYSSESVGIATGLLIAALHHSGLASLTHTPSPMKFLNQILHRPDNEKPFLILVTGYPAPNAQVPVITKKTIEQIATWV